MIDLYWLAIPLPVLYVDCHVVHRVFQRSPFVTFYYEIPHHAFLDRPFSFFFGLLFGLCFGSGVLGNGFSSIALLYWKLSIV